MSSSVDLFEKTHLSDIIPDVAFTVPEMDDGLIQYYLRMTIIKFARTASILRRHVEFETFDNTKEYFISLPDGYKPYKLINLNLNDCCLSNVPSCDCIDNHDGNGSCCNWCDDHFKDCFEYHQGRIKLCQPTCRNDCLSADIIVIPSRTSCFIDSHIVDEYPDAILEGFKSIIYGGNDKRWKNLTESRIALREFKSLAEIARTEYMSGNVSNKVVRVSG